MKLQAILLSLLPCLILGALGVKTAAAETPPKVATVSNEGLVAWWKGEGNAFDSAGVHNGYPHGVGYNTGMVGQAFEFSGDSSGINIEDSDDLRLTGAITINAWVDVFANPGQWGMIFFRGDDRSGLDPIQLSLNPSGDLVFKIECETGSITVSAPITKHEFVMVTATLNPENGAMSVYENGRLMEQKITQFGPMYALDPKSNPSIGIGHHGGWPTSPHQYGFTGLIDELKVYNRCLNADDVKAEYMDVVKK